MLVGDRIETLHISGPVTVDLYDALLGGALPNLQDLARILSRDPQSYTILRVLRLSLREQPVYSAFDGEPLRLA